MSTLTPGDSYYPYADYESHCKTVDYPPFICNLFPETFGPIWEEVLVQLKYDPLMRSTSILYILKDMYPEKSMLLDHKPATYKIRSYLYSLLNDPTKRSRVTPSLVLDLLHNPEDV